MPPAIRPPTATAGTAPPVDLERAFEGVDVFMDVRGLAVRTLVPRSLLQARFCAGESPESWVDCFVAYRDVFHRATLRRFEASPSNPIVLGEDDI